MIQHTYTFWKLLISSEFHGTWGEFGWYIATERRVKLRLTIHTPISIRISRWYWLFMVKSKIFVRWNQAFFWKLFGIGNSIISVFLPFLVICVCVLFCPFPYFPSNTKTQCLFPYFDIYFRDAFVCFCWFIRLWHRPHTRRSSARDYNSVVLVSHSPRKKIGENKYVSRGEWNWILSSASVNCSPISVPTANGDVLLECSPIFLRELTDFNGNGNLLKS